MESEREIIEMMRAAAPPGQPSLGDTAVRQLQRLTESLITAKGGASEEYERFRAISQRALCLPQALLTEWLQGAVVLVTGGTGCIGSTLMAQLARRRPGRLVSVGSGRLHRLDRAGERGVPGGLTSGTGTRMDEIIAQVRPDVIFHAAAQRPPPWPRSRRTARSPPTCSAPATCWPRPRRRACPRWCAHRPARRCAPTRPRCTPPPSAPPNGPPRSRPHEASSSCSAARFTHVVDNSIVYERLLDWAAADGGGGGRTDPGSGEAAGRPAARRVGCLLRPVGPRIGSAPADRVPGGQVGVSSGCTPSPTSAGR